MTAVLTAGFLMPVPDIPILHETSRNLFFHVPMWFAMTVVFAGGLIFSIRYLASNNMRMDALAESATMIGILFGICGLLTGSLWARFTWGTWWTFAEPKMNLSAMALMIYVAYFILRSAFDDPEKRAKTAAVYNIFAATTVPFLLYVIPRQLPSLHPGADGNPAFSDLTAPELRLVFYPAVLGFIGLAIWIIQLRYRYLMLESHDGSFENPPNPEKSAE
ncbi:cytochrome c biogenesis protein CcsA [Natronogracilivirgula saccharolytica]|uniref:Cytochrome c biogenesis protein CcsA n=2 Tax=Natronogracilivirga saccharolytica TaxID=2812953 RepID=A0A8J7RM53_9BACT|nr:cytochrome c biogenesis protein CcsA [Natronogracilivirga saccharolytica]